MDEELNAEIERLADEAQAIAPHTADIDDLAQRLNARLPHRTVDEIRERMKDVWRQRRLFWD